MTDAAGSAPAGAGAVPPRPAILDAVRPGAPTIIEASAGTGKTWTLVELVLDRLRGGAGIESILVVTFTDKATREMRARVRLALEERVRAGERALVPALLGFDRAPISTIHAFCQRLLREHAFDGGRLFAEERVDGAALTARALREVLREGLVPGAPLEPYLLAAIDALGTGGLEDAVLELSRERGELEPRFDLAALEAALTALAAAPDPDAELQRAVGHAGTRGRALRGLESLAGVLAARPAGAPPPLGALLGWAARGDPPLAGWLAETLSSTSLAAPLATLAESLSGPAPMLAATVIPAVRARAAETKRALGALDYDDLLLELQAALAGERGATLRARVRARLRHVLVDEFQDTDPVQWEIFRRLFFDCEGGRTLVLIGDPKQAIYAFRGADLRTYERARAEVEGAGGPLARLEASHRSSPAFLEALHRILLPAEGEAPFFSRPDAYPAPVRAARPEPGAVDAAGRELPPVTLFQLESQAPGPLGVKPARLAYGRAIAAEIEALLADPPLVSTREGPRRPLVASDVFVLTRSAAEGKEIGAALARRGIAHAFFKEEGLYRTREARDLLDVLRALAAPDDARLRARALLTPFFAVALEDLGALRGLDHAHPVLAPFFELARVAARGELAALFSALTDRTGLSRRELYLHQSERRLTNYLHLTEVALRLGREEHAGLGGIVAALARRIEGHGGRRGEDDEDVQRLESDREAVQILTMHKAKGLEAHVVFLYGGFGRAREREGARRTYHDEAGRRVARVGRAPAAIEAKIAAEAREEDERLLYVAMTRARACLHLPYPGRGPGSTPGPGALTMRAPGAMGRVLERLAEIVPRASAGSRDAALFRRVAVDVDAPTRGARGPVRALVPRTRAELLAHRALSPLSAAELERLAAGATGPIVTSYTRMKGERARLLDAAGDGDDDALVVLARSEPEDAEGAGASVRGEGGAPALDAATVARLDPGGAPFGVAVHALLERMDWALARGAPGPAALLAAPACASLAREVLATAGVGDEALPRAVELAWLALRTPLEAGGLRLPEGLASVARRAAEVPFLHPIPEAAHLPLGAAAPDGWRVERGYVRGVIDLLFEHEGRVWVVDYKTDRLERWTEESVALHVRDGYEVQLRLYALAAARMPGLAGRAAWEARFGGIVYAFLRGLGPAPRAATFVACPTFDELGRWDQEMRASDAPWGYPLGLGRRSA